MLSEGKGDTREEEKRKTRGRRPGKTLTKKNLRHGVGKKVSRF